MVREADAGSAGQGEGAATLDAVIRVLRASQRLPEAERVSPETVLLERGLALDSVSVLQFVLALEEEFGCALDPDEISPRNFETVAAVAALIRARTSGGRRSDA